ncbi:hypothetical protein Sjap_013433 [Stephania japonica]|uniref:Uncharacterized protein n=1 Tax=Stephania japonica TaxID=461633 RepID=A0AAP0IXW8_9MAGN
MPTSAHRASPLVIGCKLIKPQQIVMADQPSMGKTSTGDVKGQLDGMSQRISSHDQQLQEILRLLRAQATGSPSTSAAPVVQVGSVLTIQDTPAAPIVARSIAIRAGMSKTLVQRRSAIDTMSISAHSVPHVCLGQGLREHAVRTSPRPNMGTMSLTYVLGSEHHLHAVETPPKPLYSTTSRRRDTVHSGKFYKFLETFGNLSGLEHDNVSDTVITKAQGASPRRLGRGPRAYPVRAPLRVGTLRRHSMASGAVSTRAMPCGCHPGTLICGEHLGLGAVAVMGRVGNAGVLGRGPVLSWSVCPGSCFDHYYRSMDF